MQNMVGKLNHAIALGSFSGGRVWIEDDEGTSMEKLSKNGKVRELKGSKAHGLTFMTSLCLSTHDAFVKLNHMKVICGR